MTKTWFLKGESITILLRAITTTRIRSIDETRVFYTNRIISPHYCWSPRIFSSGICWRSTIATRNLHLGKDCRPALRVKIYSTVWIVNKISRFPPRTYLEIINDSVVFGKICEEKIVIIVVRLTMITIFFEGSVLTIFINNTRHTPAEDTPSVRNTSLFIRPASHLCGIVRSYGNDLDDILREERQTNRERF